MVHISADARLVDPLIEELLAQLGLGVQNLGHEVLQINHFHALAAKDVREGVVLLLGHGEERDVVEQELLKRIGGEVQQLVAGAVKDDLLEVADFALDVYACHENPPYAFYAFSDFLEAERPLRTARSDCKTNFSRFTLKSNYQNFSKRYFQDDLRKR